MTWQRCCISENLIKVMQEMYMNSNDVVWNGFRQQEKNSVEPAWAGGGHVMCR